MNTPIAVAHPSLAYLFDPLFEAGLSGATILVVWSMCPPRIRHRPGGSKRPTRHVPRQPACASGQAPKLSAYGVLKHLFVEAKIGDHLPRLSILVLKLLQPPHFGRQQAVV